MIVKKNKAVSILYLVLGLIVFSPTGVLADCANPAGIEGQRFYNADHKTMQLCDGADWWSMKGGTVLPSDCAEGDGVVMTSAGYWDCSPGGPP